MRALVEAVLARSWRPESPWHGEEHWRCVAATGMELARTTAGADAAVAFAFGLLHDTRRANENHDPEHGLRAAAFARELHAEGTLAVARDELELLARAIELHSDGLVDGEPTVAACWDADRLHLPRVGIEPDPARFSGPLAALPAWRERAATVRSRPPAWDELVAAAVAGPTPGSYRVAGRFFAGGYPTELAALEAVDVLVDLTDGELPPYERSLRAGARRVSFPIADFSAPSEERLAAILDAIDTELQAGRTVYLHCWGGIGRTGTVVGCWLARHGTAGEAALERLAALRAGTRDAARHSPETEEQRALVVRWREGA